MGFWSQLMGGVDTYDAAQRVLSDPYEPWGTRSGWSVADPGVPLPMYTKTAVEEFWRTQPNVRKVIDFIARAVATIPLHTHERIDDDHRARITDHALPSLLSNPAPGVTPFRFWRGVLSDGLLYDKWAVLIIEDGEREQGYKLVHVPSWRLHFVTDALNQVVAVRYWVGDQSPDATARNGWKDLPLEDLIFSHGYAPRGAGLSPIVTLTDILAESSEAVKYRRQVWANGARTGAWVERPPGIPWSEPARNRWIQSFRASFTGNGENAGGVPLLEDGMKLHDRETFTPQDSMDLEGRRLTAIEVAAAFHIAPELVGAQQGNYSNVREFRQMLYRDNLGPYIVDWEQAVHVKLTAKLAGPRKLYVEANIESKLRGSFEEQAQMMQSSIGAPWVTRDEGRAMMNMPPIDGGDELVVPLNVTTGGQASPRDSGNQNLNARRKSIRVKNRAPDTYTTKAQDVLSAFFKRQSKTVLSALGAKSADMWWDDERWNRELSEDLLRVANLVSTQVAASTLDSLGVSPDEYDPERTLAFLKAVSERIAGSINAATKAQLDATLAATTETDRTEALKHVFDVAETSRAEQSAATVVTTYSAFGTTEAARQVAEDSATKTWITTSGNPRSSHAGMDGETVAISENFSNGAAWPGDAMALSVEDIAGCQCDIIISLGG